MKALAEQIAGALAFLQPLGVEAGIGAEPIGRLEVDDKKGNRAIGPGLQDEAAFEFQGRAEQSRQDDSLAEQLADRGRIIVSGEDVVECGTEPGQPAAQIERVDLERQHGVVDGNRRRRTDRRLW